MKNNFFGFLGIAAKAGKCLYGSFACEKSVKSGKSKLLIFDCALSQRSRHDMVNMCVYYKTPYIESEPAYEAGKACGRNGIMNISITDSGFAEKLLELSKCGGATLGQNSNT